MKKTLVKVQNRNVLTWPTGGAFIKNGNLEERSSDMMSTSRAAQHCWMYQPESTRLQVKLTAKIFSEYGRTATMSNCFKFWLVPFYKYSACCVLVQLRAAAEKKISSTNMTASLESSSWTVTREYCLNAAGSPATARGTPVTLAWIPWIQMDVRWCNRMSFFEGS